MPTTVVEGVERGASATDSVDSTAVTTLPLRESASLIAMKKRLNERPQIRIAIRTGLPFSLALLLSANVPCLSSCLHDLFHSGLTRHQPVLGPSGLVSGLGRFP